MICAQLLRAMLHTLAVSWIFIGRAVTTKAFSSTRSDGGGSLSHHLRKYACADQQVRDRMHERRTGTTMLFAETIAITSDVSQEEKDEGSDEAGKWWSEFELQDGDLAEQIRSQFPILSTMVGGGPEEVGQEKKPLVYLDSAATSQKPLMVTNALTKYYHESNSNVHRGAHCLSRIATDKYEAARDRVARFVNANNRNEIVFTSGATEALNLVAYSWGRKNLRKGDEVLLSVMEHHSNMVPWQIIAEETGAVLKYIPLRCTEDGGDLLNIDAFKSLVTDKTKIISVQHVSNVLGCINPIPDMVQYAKGYNPDILFTVDACQSVPHQPVDVQALGIDFLAASGHKMCGPTGIGFLWGKEELLNSLPPFMGGGEMIQDVTLEKSTYAPAPGRFEAGTPQIAQAIGLGVAAEYLTKIGMDRIASYEHELAAYMHRRLAEVERVRILGPANPDERAALVSFIVDGVHPSDLSTFLDMEGIAIRAGHHCCQPLHTELGVSHSARASLYFYNTKDDVEHFVEKLVETIDFFTSVENGVEEGFF